MPHRTLVYRLRGLTLLALLASLFGVSGAMIWGIRGFAESAEWVSHTQQVLAQLQSVRTAVRVAESTARGYRLVKLPSLYAEYAVNRPQAIEAARELAGLVADNPVQEQRAAHLRRLVAARLDEIDRTLELFREGRTEESLVMTAGGHGVRLMAELDALADQIHGAEAGLLVKREVETAKKATLLTGFVLAGLLLSLSILAVLLTTVARETRRARVLEGEARDALATLEASTAQREQLAEQRRVLGAFAGLLHSCENLDEALTIGGNALQQLIPHGAGVCYVMRASQNMLETRPLFGTRGHEYGEGMRADQCWGLRMGHTHAYDPARPTVACEHLRGLGSDQLHGACVPLISQGAVLGLIHVSARDGTALTPLERAAIESVAEHLAVVLHSLQLRESLRVQSLRDPLTGLYNRRYLDESLPREIERCERRGRPLSVMMLDVDHFKRFNDEHGHVAGDALLARIGEVLAAVTRGEDIACRYGGEEFAVVMPEANQAQAAERAEQIRIAIGGASVTYMRREIGPVTASIGVHELRSRIDTPESLIANADRNLYAAKHAGRNRVLCSADASGMTAPTPA